MLRHLLARKLVSFRNAVLAQTGWELGRNAAFLMVGFWMLAGLYFGFHRLLRYLDSVQLVGPLLIWKLTAMALMTTFSMIILSTLIISLTTFYYSYDLPFLIRAPLSARTVFIDKSVEAAFFSSWMIALALLPFMLALGAVKSAGLPFLALFCALMVPFLVIATSLGMAFTLLLMYLFPSPRTRDVIWVMSSFSVALLYVLVRVSQPEKLVRPDALMLVSQYLGYLQAPTAPYLPSWWMTQALAAWIGGKTAVAARYAAMLAGCAVAVYAALLWIAQRVYLASYSGAQEGRRGRRPIAVDPTWEQALFARMRSTSSIPSLYWKERKCFFRDVTHWSQMVLIAALMCVYLFSIRHLPLDSPDLKSLVSFLNLGIAGFVLSSLGLRFTFPAISLEGKSFWVLRAAPVSVGTLMREKFLFSVIPMLLLSSILVLVSNHLLQADWFISWLSFGTIILMTVTLCGMGVGFGAVFPRFNIPNIHQIESSAGGFVYMAACLFYVGLTVALEAAPVQMHFQSRFGKHDAWRWPVVAYCAGALAAASLAAFLVPWTIGRRTLERHEEA
ncbi:MAG: hypothetical protein HY078_05420 [Elusimicrobia bacterium]|nr:hypothetical protein [Elusimicrobiota bacterium]